MLALAFGHAGTENLLVPQLELFSFFKSCISMLSLQANFFLNEFLGKVNQSAAQEQHKYGS